MKRVVELRGVGFVKETMEIQQLRAIAVYIREDLDFGKYSLALFLFE